jgi:hypothetical protein
MCPNIARSLKASKKLIPVLLYGRTAVFDVLMIFLIIRVGMVREMLVVFPLYFFYCVSLVWSYDLFLNSGHDLAGMEYMRKLQEKKFAKWKITGKVFQWMMRRRSTIFVVGSFFLLNPDGVTLILRKSRESRFRNTLTITLPSTAVSIFFWTIFFKLGIMGVTFFKWFVQ